MGENPPAMQEPQETWVQSLGGEDPLEEGMTTHSSILTWRIPSDRGTWWLTVHGVTKSRTQLKRLNTHIHAHTHMHISSVQFSSVQFSSVTQSCLTLCDPMNRSTPGLPVHHHLPEFTQTHVHQVSDAIQPSHPLSSPSPFAPNPSQHQSLFQ